MKQAELDAILREHNKKMDRLSEARVVSRSDYLDLSEENLCGLVFGGRVCYVIFDDAMMKRTTFSGAEVYDCSFVYTSMRSACVRNTSFENCNFSRALMCNMTYDGVSFIGCDIDGASLSASSFNDVRFEHCTMTSCSVADSQIYGSTFLHVDAFRSSFCGSSFGGTKFTDCCLASTFFGNIAVTDSVVSSCRLNGAVFAPEGCGSFLFDNCYINHTTIGLHPAPEGDLIGWGWKGGSLVKLLIPADSERSCGTDRKHRCRYAVVLSVDGTDTKTAETVHGCTVTQYIPGQEVHCDYWDKDRWNTCSGGIHFFLTKDEALAYGGANTVFSTEGSNNE